MKIDWNIWPRDWDVADKLLCICGSGITLTVGTILAGALPWLPVTAGVFGVLLQTYKIAAIFLVVLRPKISLFLRAVLLVAVIAEQIIVELTVLAVASTKVAVHSDPTVCFFPASVIVWLLIGTMMLADPFGLLLIAAAVNRKR